MKHPSLIDKAFFLKKTRIFSDLDLDLLLAIAEKTQSTIYETNTPIFSLGKRPDQLFILMEGNIDILDATNTKLFSLTNHEFFGEESLFTGKPYTYTAIAKTQTLLLAISRPHLITIITECPIVGISLLEIFAHYASIDKKK